MSQQPRSTDYYLWCYYLPLVKAAMSCHDCPYTNYTYVVCMCTWWSVCVQLHVVVVCRYWLVRTSWWVHPHWQKPSLGRAPGQSFCPLTGLRNRTLSRSALWRAGLAGTYTERGDPRYTFHFHCVIKNHTLCTIWLPTYSCFHTRSTDCNVMSHLYPPQVKALTNT